MIVSVKGNKYWCDDNAENVNRINLYRVIGEVDFVTKLDRLNEKLFDDFWNKELPRKYEVTDFVLTPANSVNDENSDLYYLTTVEGITTSQSENCCIIFPSEMSCSMQSELVDLLLKKVKDYGISLEHSLTDGEYVFLSIDVDGLKNSIGNGDL